jgi:hypothetical protein
MKTDGTNNSPRPSSLTWSLGRSRISTVALCQTTVQPGHGAGPANAGELAGQVDHIAFEIACSCGQSGAIRAVQAI